MPDRPSLDRRRFLAGSGAALLGAAALPGCALDDASVAGSTRAASGLDRAAPRRTHTGRLIVSTWKFGVAANAVAWDALGAGVEHPVHAAVAGVRVPEGDPSITSVGYGGAPNADGVMELDSCVMRGDTLACGGVAGLQDIAHPVDVARDVMEHTPHVLLVGAGALAFARSRGHAERDLLSPKAAERYAKWMAKQERPDPIEDHDTIGMIVLENGRLGMAVTTSGWGYKLPGRVGDSPIVGAGGYCDDEAGACVATGTGEEMIRHAASFAVVEQMRNGASARAAVDTVLARVRRSLDARGINQMVALLAVDTRGAVAGRCTTKGFQYAVHDAAGGRLLEGELFA